MSTNDPATLFDLLARGVPWPIALEAVATMAIDRDERAQTIALAPEPSQ